MHGMSSDLKREKHNVYVRERTRVGCGCRLGRRRLCVNGRRPAAPTVGGGWESEYEWWLAWEWARERPFWREDDTAVEDEVGDELWLWVLFWA